MDSQKTKYDKRRFWERILVGASFILILTFGFMEGWFFQRRSSLPLYGNILLFSFINLNVLLLLFLAYMVLRNIVKLIFERKRNILGSKLKTRLVTASVGLTLIPAVPLFWLASQFIFSSLDHWFSSQVEQSLEDSVLLAKQYVEQERANLVADCIIMMPEIVALAERQKDRTDTGADVQRLLYRNRIEALIIYDSSGVTEWRTIYGIPEINAAMLKNRFKKENTNSSRIINLKPKEQDAIAAQIMLPSEVSTQIEGRFIAVRLLPSQLTRKLDSITAGYENYLQLKMLNLPLKKSHFITFSIVTMLAIFAAVWFGFYLAKNLTVPIQNLVTATQRIAEGDLDVRLDSTRQDEIGMLIASFNNMTGDLRESREKLDLAYKALQSTNIELEDRRRYMEIVLKNIAAGVVSVDAGGNVTTMNKSAEVIFGLKAEDIRGKHYSGVSRRIAPGHRQVFHRTSYKDGTPALSRAADPC